MEEECESLLYTRLETKSTKQIFGLLWSEYTRKVKLREVIENTGKWKFFFWALPLYFLKFVFVEL